jgi:hypothetical protein
MSHEAKKIAAGPATKQPSLIGNCGAGVDHARLVSILKAAIRYSATGSTNERQAPLPTVGQTPIRI